MITSEFNDSTNKKIVEINTITINEIVDNLNQNGNILKSDIECSGFDIIE